jgi:hypothetical protein
MRSEDVRGRGIRSEKGQGVPFTVEYWLAWEIHSIESLERQLKVVKCEPVSSGTSYDNVSQRIKIRLTSSIFRSGSKITLT